MRTRPRLAAAATVAAALTLAACGDSGSSEPDEPGNGAETGTEADDGTADATNGSGECARVEAVSEEPPAAVETYPAPDSWADDAPEVASGFGDDPAVDFADAEEPEGLVVTVLEQGDGPVVHPGDQVVIDYHGQQWGSEEVFDSSFERPDPADFPLDNLIPGWQEGLPGTHAGDRLLLSIPADLGYGEIADDEGMTEQGSPGGTLAFVIDVHGSYGPASMGQADAELTGEAESLPMEIVGGLGEPVCVTVDSSAEEPDDFSATVIAEGSGEPVAEGDDLLLQFTAALWDNSIEESTWDGVGPQRATAGGEEFTTMLIDAPIGSRVALLMPPVDPDADEESPDSQSTVFVVDIVGSMPQR